MSNLLQKREMPYGAYSVSCRSKQAKTSEPVRLGNSGLKVSRVILGCLSLGTPDRASWVLGEEESHKMIKAAYVKFDLSGMHSHYSMTNSYDAGINTFDTANVCVCKSAV
jgi:aryl-alcohol dehydrogenase-like predicted oxidoreductase